MRIYTVVLYFSQSAFSLTTSTFLHCNIWPLVFVLRQNTLKDSWWPSFIRIPNHIELCLGFSACGCINARMNSFYLALRYLYITLGFLPFPQPQWVNINYDFHLNFLCFYTCLNLLFIFSHINLHPLFGIIYLSQFSKLTSNEAKDEVT